MCINIKPHGKRKSAVKLYKIFKTLGGGNYVCCNYTIIVIVV